MGLSSIFNCLLCGRSASKQIVEGKVNDFDAESKLHHHSTESQDSSDAESPAKLAPLVTIVTDPTPTPTFSKNNRALIVASKRTYGIVEESFPEFKNENEVVIRSVAVGLNPIDWKSVDYNFCLPEFPWITGREMAGVVEKVGSSVTDIKVGDKVWTSKYHLCTSDVLI